MVAKPAPLMLSAVALTWMMSMSVAARAETVAGRVLGPEGKPVVGAAVTLSRVFGTDMPLPVVMTDTNGAFRLDVSLSDQPRDGSVKPSYWIVAYAPGFALKETNVASGSTVEVRLEPSGTVKGRVTTGGQPVAGAAVRLRTLLKGERWPDIQFINIPDALADRLTTKTGADGTYTLPGVPRDFKAVIELADERFVRLSVQVPLNGQAEVTAPVLEARPGGTVEGKAVLPDGKPAVGVRVFAQGHAGSNGGANAVTDAEGRYRLRSLSGGVYNIMADAPPSAKDTVAAAIEGASVTEGKTLTVADLRFTSGAVVEGRILDAETGEPLRNASIGSYGPHRPRSSAAIILAQTDETGHYRLRVAPGESYIYLSGIPTGYVRDPMTGATLKVSAGETKTQDFRLKKGLTLAGRIVDDGGQVVKGLPVRVQVRYEDYYPQYASDGSFTVGGLMPGDATLTLTSDEWDLVEPAKITLPTEQPITIHVKRSNRATLTGRVVDTAGSPVAGATVRAAIRVQLGDGLYTTQNKTATTDAQGRFSIPGVKPDDKVAIFAARDGYRFLRGGEIGAAENGIRPASDMIVAALNRAVQGQILGDNGKPLAGVPVISADGQETKVVTDAAGRFTLNGLPAGETAVLAASGRSFARANLKNGETTATLTLSPMPIPTKPDVPRAVALLEELYKETSAANYYGRDRIAFDLVPYDLDRALRLAADDKGMIPDDRARTIMTMLSVRDPARAVAFGTPRLGTFQDDYMRRVFYVDMGRAYVRLGRTVELGDMYKRLAADVANSGALKPDAPANGETMYALTFLTTLGAMSRAPETEDLARRTLELSRKVQGEKAFAEQGFGAALVGSIAEGDPILAEKIARTLPEKAQPQAYRQAIEKAAVYSPTAARNMLKRMDELGANKRGFEGREYGRAAVKVAEVLIPKDPDGAITIARGVVDPKYRGLALATAARQLTTPEKRAALYREAFDLTVGSGEYNVITPGARVASIVAETDPTLAKTLFERLYELDKGRTDDMNLEAVAALCFYSARLLPARSRLLLETSFGAGMTSDYARQYGPYYLAKLATAMTALDPDRALEMVNQLPKGENDSDQRYDARRNIARFLLAPDKMDINEDGQFDLPMLP